MSCRKTGKSKNQCNRLLKKIFRESNTYSGKKVHFTEFFDHEIVSIVVIVLTLLIFFLRPFVFVDIMTTTVFNTICAHYVYNSIQHHLCTSCLQYYSIPFVHIMSTIHSDQFRSNSYQCAHYEHNSV